MNFYWSDCQISLVLVFTVILSTRSTSESYARFITGIDVSGLREGLRSDSSKKLATFVLKLTPKGKTYDELTGDEQTNEYRPCKRKKDREIIKLIPADTRNSKNSADKLTELKVLQELANAHVPNSLSPAGQHNFTEGSIALGKVGNKKAGRLRFRISSGAIFSPSRQPEARPMELSPLLKAAEANASYDQSPTGDIEKDVLGKTTEMSDNDSKTGSNPQAEDPDAPPEDTDVNGDRGTVRDKKATVFKIFKNMAQQFDALQDLFLEDSGDDSNSFNRTWNRMTLENISSCQGNFTRVRFIRRKETENEKKPKARSTEQLVAEGDY